MNKKLKIMLLAPVAIAGGIAAAYYHIGIIILIAFIAILFATGGIKVKVSHSIRNLSPEEAAIQKRKGISVNFTTDGNFSTNSTEDFLNPPPINIGTNYSLEDNLRSSANLAYNLEWPVSIYYMLLQYLPFNSLIGLIVSLKNRKKAEGTIYASHFNWIIRTYYLSLAFLLVIGFLTIAFMVFAVHAHLPPITIPIAAITSIGGLLVWLVFWTNDRMKKGAALLKQNLPIDSFTYASA